MIGPKQTADNIDLQKYIYMLLAKKWFFVAAVVISFSTVTAYFSFRGPLYVAQSDVAVEDPTFRRGLLIEEINDRKLQIKTRIAHLTSQKLLREVVKTLDLRERLGSSTATSL